MHGGSDAGCDGQLAGDTDDQYALTGEKTHVLLLSFRLLRSGWCQKKRLPATAVYTDVGGRQRYFARLLFDHLAMLDHHQSVAQRFDDSQVMADKQIRQVVLGLQ